MDSDFSDLSVCAFWLAPTLRSRSADEDAYDEGVDDTAICFYAASA
jgi:hypothetical protein